MNLYVTALRLILADILKQGLSAPKKAAVDTPRTSSGHPEGRG